MGAPDGKLYAFNASTGGQEWSYTTGGQISSTPAVANGKVFFGSYDNKVYALDANTGGLLWSYTTGGLVVGSVTVSNGKAIFGSYDNKVYALDVNTGGLLWSYTTAGSFGIRSTPAVADGKVFLGTHDHYIYALDENTGSYLWSYTAGYDVNGSPTVANGKVFIGASDNNIYALSENTGALIWSRATGGYVEPTPIVSNGLVVTGSLDNKVYALNESDGTIAWQYTTGGWIISNPALAEGNIYIGSGDGKLYVLNLSTGAKIQEYTVGGAIHSSPAIANGIVYVGSNDGKLYAFGPDTTPPVQSAWNPAKGTTINTTSPTITFTTDENADCKWSLSDQAYGSMVGDCTGDGTTSQSCAATGLSVGAVVVYIACRDSLMNADTVATNQHINYTVNGAPVVTSVSFTPSSIPADGVTTTTVTTNVTDPNGAGDVQSVTINLTPIGGGSAAALTLIGGDSFQKTGITVPLGVAPGAYVFTVTAMDMQGVTGTSNGSLTVTEPPDTTPPTGIATVNDGTGADISIVSSATQLSANWTAATDAESGIAKYWYAIGTTAGGSDVLGWTDNGANTSVTKTGLSLVDGTTYYFAVKAQNGAGLVGAVTSSNGAIADTAPPTLVISSPAGGSSVSGTVNVTGTVSDVSVQSWALYYGPGAAPAAWSQVSSGTGAVTDALLGVWNAAALSGPYTLKLTATDGFGRTAETSNTINVGNTATVSGTIPKLKWYLISVPVQPVSPSPLAMFGNGEYKVFRWDPTVADDPYLGKYRAPNSLGAATGFWIKSYADVDMNYSYTGTIVNTTENFTIQLKPGWNQIGAPFNQAFPWAQAQVKYNGEIYDMTTAADMNLISMTAYSYDSAAGSWVQNGVGAQLVPKVGYDVRAYQDVELLFGPGAGKQGGVARHVMPVFDYKVKISAVSADSADLDNYIGASGGASGEYDVNDAEEPPRTLESRYTSLYFPRADWTRNAGRYANEIRASAASAGDTETWTFNVETNETGESVTLMWDAASLPGDRYSFTLVNVDAGERIDMVKQSSYTYRAAGAGVSETRFRIEVVKLDAPAFVAAGNEVAIGSMELVAVKLKVEFDP